jgi:alpha,alpha-trehalase
MTTAFVDFNGVVPEKVRCLNRYLLSDHLILVQFDAVKLSHLVTAEYGNQGLDFKMVPREGFGWMNCTLFYVLITISHESVL